MANQNLFEKYGIKEVADVTFYRIERKNEVYESQREISVSSILKGAITTQMVYPMDEGKGADTGFEAYVFADADVLTHANYKCDDNYVDSEAENTKVTYTLTSEKFTVGTPTKEYVIQNGTPSITLDTKIKNKLTNIISSLPPPLQSATMKPSLVERRKLLWQRITILLPSLTWIDSQKI